RNNFNFYKKSFADIEKIKFLDEPSDDFFSNRWLSTILIEGSDKTDISHDGIRLELEKENIESRPLWKPMHMQPVFKDAPFYGDGTSEKLFEKGLCFPSGSNLSDEDLERVVRKIRECFGK